ncbi:MAG: PTS glucose transporter subunit IIA [Eubacteriales bacterium]|nr:PTS glucose transporter subunit IIA [Eubacteriales bacterium]
MGLFDLFKGKNAEAPIPEEVTFPVTLEAVSTGKYVTMSQVPDEVFSTGVLGVCCGIDPEEGRVYAPISGKVIQLADTLHAIGIEAGGIELLIHVGIDTVEMNGEGFCAAVKEGQYVKKGDLLLTMDLDKIHAAGHPATVIMAITNSDDFTAVESVAASAVHPGDGVLWVSK